ncbi:Suppressor of the cold-sensitive snRNP biogenesis mutant brr1-1 [Podila clonocystis]|nr:Suppressor of the cold-sensitive snRNP biogenesis mutant brr1-1 [Podila clonocystis]
MSTTEYPAMTYPDDLIDYDEDMDLNLGSSSATHMSENKGMDLSVGASTAAFRDLLLKPELYNGSASLNPCSAWIHSASKSGTGKTAVFVLSTLQQLHPIDGQVSAIVLCNTHELAYQIKGEFARFCKYLPEVRSEVFYGGKPIAADQAVLANKSRSPHVVVGTPGRIKDLIERRHLNVEYIKHFILDECDKLLEGDNMRCDVQQIFMACPRAKQVLMFSATVNDLIRKRCKLFMFNPLEVYVDDEAKSTINGLQQYYINLKESEKNRKLSELLDALKFNQVFIFVKSVERAIHLDRLLNAINFPSIAIHAQTSQKTRMGHFQGFKEFEKRIAVSTDVFSRGVDVSQVNVVINYDFPCDADTYLHRVGRTGRFGTKGLAISFASSNDNMVVLKNMQDRFGVKIPEMPNKMDVADYMNA